MLAAKDEKNAIGATLFFNFMHYAMRPWPWIIVALASLLCFPTLESIQTQFPNIDPTYLKQDIAYPAMIARLGPGFLGLVVASLIAAYMSTIGTHLNWGSSYAVNDFYARFVRKDASQKELVLVARLMTVLLMVLAGVVALVVLQNAGQAFKFLLLSGAGTGAIYLLRWFWYRINAWTEIAGMVAASIVAIWIIAGPGDEGTKAWIVDYKTVQPFVYKVKDQSLAGKIQQEQKQIQPKIKNLESEINSLKNDKSKRDQYVVKFNELQRLKTQHTILSLFKKQNPVEFEKAKEKLAKDGKTKDGSTVALIKNGSIYIYDSRVDSLVFPVQLLICVAVVTLAWLITTLLTKPADTSTLRNFYKLCHPGGPGWKKVVLAARENDEEIDQKNSVSDWKLPIQLLCVFIGCVAIYTSLFSVGNFVYGNIMSGIIMSIVAAVSTFVLLKLFGKLGAE